MGESISKILKLISANTAGIVAGTSFAAGALIAFLGLFEVHTAPYSFALRAPSAWLPLVVGAVFVAIGIALIFLKPDSSTLDPEKELTARLIFLLRHVAEARDFRPTSNFEIALISFNSGASSLDTIKSARAGWAKATEYALLHLHTLGLVERQNTAEYLLSKKGRKILESRDIYKKYTSGFTKRLVDLPNTY